MKTTTTLPTLAAAILAGIGLIALPGHAQITAGFDFFVDASQDTDGDQVWEDLTAGNPTGSDLLLDDSPAVTRVAVTGSSTQFTHAYDLPGGAIDNNAGALLVDRGTTTQRSFGENDDGAWDTQPVTLEIWLRPDELTPDNASNTNGQIIFEDGGGTGLGILLDDSGELVVTHDGGENQIRYDLNTDPDTVLLGAPTSEFMQVVVTHDTASPFQTVLYLNGQQVGTSNDDNDWSGGDAAGFGTRGDNNVGGLGSGQQSTETFDGQMALIRAYRAQILTPTEVLANFNELSGPDTVAPSIAALDPADDASGVYPAGNLVASFSEEITPGMGNITIKDLDNTTDTLIAIDDTTQVSFSGSDLIIDPAVNLLFDTNYAVQIDNGAIFDTTTNAFTGIIDTTTWNFSTAAFDGTAPAIDTLFPADNTTNVIPDVVLTATFDENIVLGGGDIRINVVGGSTVQTIAVTDGSQVSVSGATLTITPATPLPPAIELAVELDAGIVKNFSDVGNLAVSGDATWSFTTASTTTYTGPNTTNADTWNKSANWDVAVPSGALDVVIPAGKTVTADDSGLPQYTGDLSIGDGSTLRIEWLGNEGVLYDALGTPGQTVITAGAGSRINCRAGGTHEVPEIQLTGDLTVVHSQSTQSAVTLDYDSTISGAHTFIVQGKNGSNANLNAANSFAALLVSEPGSGGAGVDVNANAAGSLGSGDVTVDAIANSSNGTVGNPVGDLRINAADAMADSGTLSLNGGGTLITMNADDTVGALNVSGFPYPAGTYGRVGTPATVDLEASFVAGDSVLTVTGDPGDTTAPLSVGMVPADNASDIFVAELFVLSFDEPMVAGAGDILVKNITDGTMRAIAASSSLEVSFNADRTVVTIDPLFNLEGGKDYAIQVEGDAFEDLFGNGWAGITNDDDWSFSTVNPKVLLSEGFEAPDVTAAQSDGNTSGAVPPGWVGATQGFGAGRRGIVDEAHGDFTDPVGEQAFAFRYTNSGLTSGEGQIGKLLLGATYTISFDVVRDDHNGGTPWRVKFVAFNDGARRDDVRSNSGTTVLLERNGTIDSTIYANQSFEFTPDLGDLGLLGKDLAVRFIGATSSATIDNVEVSVAGETVAPQIASFANDVAGGPVTAGDPVTYTVTFDEWMEASTIEAGDFENGGSAGVTVDSVSATGALNVYDVTVTTVTAGDLYLQTKTGADLRDVIGNAMDTSAPVDDPVTITVEAPAGGSAFETWALANGLDGTPGAENGTGDDPDTGGKSNLYEFGFNGDPLDAANEGLVYGFLGDGDGDTDEDLLFTLAVRAGTVFTAGSPATSAAIDGIVYTVGGDDDLDGFDNDTPVSVAASAVVPAGAPDLTGTDYEYVTLILDGSVGESLALGFMRASVELAPE